MEGTRHERAALVGVAYFLGFLTTFIWLGVNKSSNPIEPLLQVAQPAAVSQALMAESGSQAESSVAYRNGLLEVTTFGEARVLSFNPEVADINVTEDFLAQGTHVGEVIYSASQSEEYVFFCEQKTIGAKTCLPFVYDSLAQKIYPLKKDGLKVELLVEAALAAKWQGNQLSVGGELARDAKSPWLLGQI